jgi:Flp pilus assembly protein TadG
MNAQLKNIRLSRKKQRSAVAAVECAIVLPLLTLLVLGAIDVGQFANVYQKVSDASREGARAAARYGTETTSQVKSTVMSYLAEVSNGAHWLLRRKSL